MDFECCQTKLLVFLCLTEPPALQPVTIAVLKQHTQSGVDGECM